MSQDKVILATTEVIDGVMLTRESLVYAVATINGEKALRQIVDHDPCSIPLEVWPESHWPGFALRQTDVL